MHGGTHEKNSIALILVMAVNLCMLTAFLPTYTGYSYAISRVLTVRITVFPPVRLDLNEQAGSSCVYSVLTEKGTSVMMYSTDPTKVLQMRHTGAALTSAFSAETRILMKDYSVARTIA